MQQNNLTKQNNRSFTLIELLVVLALVAILSVVVILTLNPAELLKQARDSNRLSDLATINTALNLFSADVTSGFMGTSTVIYVSLPDNTSSTCGSLGLPALPAGYNYNCVTTANLRNTDGTGWIPVNFQRISSNSPISQLPTDPTNTTTTRLYYTYVPGGSWELNATIEAAKNKLGGSNDLTSKDGGNAISTYELGNNLNLNPIETGDSSLVGYWNFEEGPNATSTDRSGYGNHGTWYGTSTQQQHYAAGKVGQYAGYFNGGSDYVSGNSFNNLIYPTTTFTFVGWVKIENDGSASWNSNPLLRTKYHMTLIRETTNQFVARTEVGTAKAVYAPAIGASNRSWHQFTAKYIAAGSASRLTVYVDGSYGSSISLPGISDSTYANLGIGYDGIGHLSGTVDDFRVYSRDLSADEILALYNSTK